MCNFIIIKVFKIFNEGYDNYNLKHNIITELGSINLKVNYIEGKNLSVTKTKIRVELQFSNSKP